MPVLGRSHVEATVNRAQMHYSDAAMLGYSSAEAYQKDAWQHKGKATQLVETSLILFYSLDVKLVPMIFFYVKLVPMIRV